MPAFAPTRGKSSWPRAARPDLPRPLAPDAEIGGHDRDLASAVRAGCRRDVDCREADLTPASSQQDLAMFGAVQPHVERTDCVDVRGRPKEVLPDRPVVLPGDRVVAGDALVEGRSVRGVVTEVTALRHLGRVLARGRCELRGEPQRRKLVVVTEAVDVREHAPLERAQRACGLLTRRTRGGGDGPQRYDRGNEGETTKGAVGHPCD